MSPTLQRVFVVVALAGAMAPSVRAQEAEMLRILSVAGDGAAGCSAAKSAFSARRIPAPASAGSANLDATYYHLDLVVGFDPDTLTGTVRVEGTVVGSPLSVLVLDLAASMTVTAVALGDGTPLSFSHPGAVLNIMLPSPVAAGGRVAVDITYGGTPVVLDFGNFVFGTRAGARLAWSLSEPYGSREWWPCKDHPADKADSVRVTVTVPSQYRVGSQGILVNETSATGMTTYDWVSRYPVSTYLVSVAIGDYLHFQGTYDRPAALEARYGPLSLALEHLVYNDATPDLPTGWANVTGQLEVFEDWFGPYPFPDEKYGHAEFTFGGGMEHQTMSSMGGSHTGLVSHELAHQWYGDSISPKQWRHLWLNEGFATYAELIYWEARAAAFPEVADSLLTILEAVYHARYRFSRGAPGTLVLADTSSVNDMFDGRRVYAKGSMVLHMLRYVVGDAAFRDILAAWAADPAAAYGVAETDDFIRVAETVSGMDLGVFFRQWVTHGTGYPTYAFSALWQPAGTGYRVWATVAQTQTPPQSNMSVFEMPLEIAVLTTDGEERVRVQNDSRTQVFEFDVTSQPKAVAIDPDRWILRADTDTLSTARVPPHPTILSLAPNPARDSALLQYTMDRAGGVVVNVYDVRGRHVHSQRSSSSGFGVLFETVDTASLASGVYFLRLETPGGQATRKFVVLH